MRRYSVSLDEVAVSAMARPHFTYCPLNMLLMCRTAGSRTCYRCNIGQAIGRTVNPKRVLQAEAEAAMAEAVADSNAAQGALDEFATRTRPFSPPPGSLRPHGRFVPVRPA